jgi:NAD(P)-dependent dehydrogenase (short-subunit alcohol dehydrogenase family)
MLVRTADITKEEIKAAFVKSTQHFHAAPDLPVNNSGGPVDSGSLANSSLSSFWKTFKLGILGRMTVTQAFFHSYKVTPFRD